MKISELKNCPQWLSLVITVNADVEVSENGWVTWNSGDFHGGNFRGGNFLGGDFWGGNFRGGNFRGGDFRGGLVMGVKARVVVTCMNVEHYPKTLVDVGGVAWILAGCRWFTFAESKKHWAKRKNRPITRALLIGVEALIKQKKLKLK